jgi:hypothetical protein
MSNVKGGKLQRQQRLLLNIGLMKDNRRVLGKQITTAVNEIKVDVDRKEERIKEQNASIERVDAQVKKVN